MNKLLLVLVCLILGACQSVAKQPVSTATDQPEPVPSTEPDPDPWEGFNRAMFAFNDVLDVYLLKPTAKGYKAVAPEPVEKGVDNVFDNLGEVRNLVNSALQWKWETAANSTGRLLVNSTIGVAGLFDVAQHMGMQERDREDFGQTLAAWGVKSGPYVVLPFLGPGTVRDRSATVVDAALDPVNYVDDSDHQIALQLFRLVNTRANLLALEELLEGEDKYALQRDAYLDRRDFLINDGEVEDDFGSDEFDADFDDIQF